ncbi:MAG: DNA double-strand break repair protein Rad50, partial [Candidatus Phytoplasma stylosanthis]|nr:DNA double-strand break repair protein Rad50 [Candidatus Phytoplasma stylosanthis]
TAGNITKFVFKGFDKVTDVLPAKLGLKIAGKTVNFTRKFGQGMVKTTFILHEGHRLWHLYNEVVNENKEHPPLITKEALEMYTKDIDRDLDKLEADYKDYEKKKTDYKLRLNQDNLKNECKNSEKLNTNIQNEFRTWIDEYEAITNDLTRKQEEVLDTYELYKNKAILENKLENNEENVNILKEQLKQKNPNYARAQQRLQAKRVGKIPEMIIIPNK